MQNEKKIKVIMAKLGLDIHWRGALIVSEILRKNGMEVIYLGNQFPEEIIDAAIDEDVNVIGLNTHGGNHLSLGGEVIEEAKRRGVYEEVVFAIGGGIPPDDISKLLDIGYDIVKTEGTTSEEIVSSVREAVKEKVKK